MNYEIKNGLLMVGGDRLVLPRVAKWKIDGNMIVFVVDGSQISINAGPQASKLDADLVTYFSIPGTLRDQIYK